MSSCASLVWDGAGSERLNTQKCILLSPVLRSNFQFLFPLGNVQQGAPKKKSRSPRLQDRRAAASAATATADATATTAKGPPGAAAAMVGGPTSGDVARDEDLASEARLKAAPQ